SYPLVNATTTPIIKYNAPENEIPMISPKVPANVGWTGEQRYDHDSHDDAPANSFRQPRPPASVAGLVPAPGMHAQSRGTPQPIPSGTALPRRAPSVYTYAG